MKRNVGNQQSITKTVNIGKSLEAILNCNLIDESILDNEKGKTEYSLCELLKYFDMDYNFLVDSVNDYLEKNSCKNISTIIDKIDSLFNESLSEVFNAIVKYQVKEYIRSLEGMKLEDLVKKIPEIFFKITFANMTCIAEFVDEDRLGDYLTYSPDVVGDMYEVAFNKDFVELTDFYTDCLNSLI